MIYIYVGEGVGGWSTEAMPWQSPQFNAKLSVLKGGIIKHRRRARRWDVEARFKQAACSFTDWCRIGRPSSDRREATVVMDRQGSRSSGKRGRGRLNSRAGCVRMHRET